MTKISLNKTKFKLTLFFALIVFCITIVLGFFYFSLKYYNGYDTQRRFFKDLTLENEDRIGLEFSINNFLGLEEIKDFERDLPSDRGGKPGFGPKNNLNYVIVDGDFDNIVYENIYEDITIDKDLTKIDYDKIYFIEGYFIKKSLIVGIDGEYDIYFFDNLDYSLLNYFKDIILFIFLSFCFSFVVFFIGRRFVESNLEPIKNTMQDMSDFIHNANHELKTPLSVISSNLQLIKKLKSYEDDIIDNSILEINKASELITVLSELSDIKNIENKDKNNLKREVDYIINEFSDKMESKRIEIKVEIDDNFTVESNKNYLHILLANLIGNAIKYNIEKGGYINISLDKNLLKIVNSGYGIDEKHLGKIFDRFFQIDTSRNSEGFGIGLSLVKKICDVYSWNIFVESELNKETIFSIKF